ncbi:MAG: endonuclease III [Puniceicoccales bacterium]|jgi:endonuclease-3|nr:endonuclease III [Puniceicoccales bacterium]
MELSRARIRAAFVERFLFERFPIVDNFLNYRTPFQLLVAVVLSARCTDRQVNRVTGQLFEKAPTAEQLADLPTEQLEELIHSVGFFRQKARALKGLASKIVANFSGVVPTNFFDLESLPGVGHKTASVLLGQWAGIPTFPVDTHVWRLARRWRLSEGRTVTAVERDLKDLFPPQRWMGLHLRMIAYGRSDCGARSCDGTKCDICRRLEHL